MEDWAHVPDGLPTVSCFLGFFSFHFPHLRSALVFPMCHVDICDSETLFLFPSLEREGACFSSILDTYFKTMVSHGHGITLSLWQLAFLPLCKVLLWFKGLWKFSRNLSSHLSHHFQPCSLLEAHWPPTPWQYQPHFTQGLPSCFLFLTHSCSTYMTLHFPQIYPDVTSQLGPFSKSPLLPP